MQITINIQASEGTLDQDLLSLELPPDTTIETLKESVHAELGIAKQSQHIYHNGQLLADNNKTLEESNVANGDMLALHVRDMGVNPGVSQGGQAQRAQTTQTQHVQAQGGAADQDPEVIRLQLLGNPALRQEIARQQPELAAALNNSQRFAQIYRQMMDQERRERALRQQEIANLNADPFDIDAQMRIAEIIRQERVQENLQNAIEHNPEGRSLGRSR
jgi:DNA damage-inducible protein 1